MAAIPLLSALAAAAPLKGEPPSSARTVCACAADKRCWKIAMMGYSEIAGTMLKEIEASLPGRFFPETSASALAFTDEGGHFLETLCGPAPCPEKRDELERRVILASFLRALPLGLEEDRLLDGRTWALTALGEKIVLDGRKCRPKLMGELVAGLSAHVPRRR